MKKINLILLALIVSFCISCSKEKISSSDTLNSDELSQALVNQYHLKLVKNDGTLPITKSFKTQDEFEQYLKSHNQKITASTKPSTALQATSSSSSDKKTIDYIGSATTGTFLTSNQFNYTSPDLHFPDFDGSGYPEYLNIGWYAGGTAYAGLSGYGAGSSWTFVQMTGYDNTNTIHITGTYIEYYTYGSYTYQSNYNYACDAAWDSTGNMEADAAYWPQ